MINYMHINIYFIKVLLGLFDSIYGNILNSLFGLTFSSVYGILNMKIPKLIYGGAAT